MTQAARNRHYCSQVHTINFGDVIELLVPISLMRILKHASPIHTAHLTRPFSQPNIKEKSGLAQETTFMYTFIVEHSQSFTERLVIMISFLMKCCNAESNSLYQPDIHVKLIVQGCAATIYRSLAS